MSGLKYYKRLDVYKSSNGNNNVNINKLEAWSYKWWQYLKKENNLVIFNSYGYSNTTTKHQMNTRSLLRGLGIKIDLHVNSYSGLQSSGWKTEVFTSIYKQLYLAQYRLTKKGLRQKTKAKLECIVTSQNEKLIQLKKIECPLSKETLKEIKKVTIDKYESELAENRVTARKLREKKKQMMSQVKDELNSLEKLNTYDSYDKLNTLEPI